MNSAEGETGFSSSLVFRCYLPPVDSHTDHDQPPGKVRREGRPANQVRLGEHHQLYQWKGGAGGQDPRPSERGPGVLVHLLESAQALPLLLLLHMQVGQAHELMNGFVHLLIQCSWAWALQPGKGVGQNESLPLFIKPPYPIPSLQPYKRWRVSWVIV